MTLEQMGKYAVLIGSHGNEMEVGGRLQKKLDTNSIPGVIYRIANPDAVAAGERFLGDSHIGEIMDVYPGNPDGNPEQRAAYDNLLWINKMKSVVVFDIHESVQNGTFFALAETASLAAIAGGREFSNRCLIVDSSFYRSVPQGIAIENSLMDSDPETTANILYQCLNKLSQVNLQEVSFEEAVSGITFYQKFEFSSFGHNSQLSPYLLELETVPGGSRYAPLILSKKQRELLSVPDEATISYGTWGHHNMSKLAPQELGYTALGIPRREYFGSYFVEIASPVPSSDGFVIFQKENRPLSRKPRGLLRLAA